MLLLSDLKIDYLRIPILYIGNGNRSEPNFIISNESKRKTSYYSYL